MRKLLIFIDVMLVLAIIAGAAAIVTFSKDVPRLPDDLKLLAAPTSTQVFARDGQLLGTLGGREYVAIERISPWFTKAMMAAEDKRFQSHHGVDHVAFFRALGLNALRGGGAPGGSSITQQLAKNLFFDFKRSWKRKIYEALAAIAIEERFSKDEILEAYSNLVYFGRFAYGIERASRIYFNKHSNQLTLAEASLLAGLPNAPSRLDPYNHLGAAKERQREILGRMLDARMITPEQLTEAANTPLKFAKRGISTEQGSFAMDYALELARAEIGSDLVNYGGVRIYTTIDLRMQRLAEQTVASGVDMLELNLKEDKNAAEGRLEGGLVAMDVATGRVMALVGGRNFQESSFNRCVHSYRQPGSCFKPIIYLSALERLGYTPETIVDDHPVSFTITPGNVWSPKNFDEEFHGQLPLREALARSINTIAAQLIDAVGPGNVIEVAHRMGIRTPLEPHLSLALGSCGVTMVELATVYATIAREGEEIEPLVVTRIEGRGGELLAEYLNAGERRFDPETVYELIGMMKGVIEHGTGTVVRTRGFTGTAIGKTGTSSDFRDSWFCGATPVLAVASWVGFDDNRQIYLSTGKGITGATGAAPIWADFMIQATAGEPNRDFPPPPGLARPVTTPGDEFIGQMKLKGN